MYEFLRLYQTTLVLFIPHLLPIFSFPSLYYLYPAIPVSVSSPGPLMFSCFLWLLHIMYSHPKTWHKEV